MPTRLPSLTLTLRSARPPQDVASSAPDSPPSAIVHKPLSAISRFGSSFFKRKTITTTNINSTTRSKCHSTRAGILGGPPRRGATVSDLLTSMSTSELTRLAAQSQSVRNMLQSGQPPIAAKADSTPTVLPKKPSEQPGKEDDARAAMQLPGGPTLVPHRPVGNTSSDILHTTRVGSAVPRRPIVSKKMSANETVVNSIVAGAATQRTVGSLRNLLPFNRAKAELPGVADVSQSMQVSESSTREQSGDASDLPPFAPQFVLDHFGSELTPLEKKEILYVPEVFYYSTLGVKMRRQNGQILSHVDMGDASDMADVAFLPAKKELHNDGYDDERGDYLMLMQDHLGYRYEVLHPLGSGSFGQVVCCLDHVTKANVAVKVIRNRKKYKEQALIEIQMLAQLLETAGSTSNVVQMTHHFVFRGHLCITFELLGMNLYDYLKLRFFQGMPMANIRVVASQLLSGLTHLRSNHIIHCDLKPENILIKAPLNCFAAGPGGSSVASANVPIESICLIDFGSSCLDSATIYTYIQSRFYRSPEVILGHPYDTGIDMWSLGCILVELHTGHPIFAGENEAEQLLCMMEILGVPPTNYLARCKRRKCFFHESQPEPTAVPVAAASDPVVLAASTSVVYKPVSFTNSRGRKRTPKVRDLGSVVKSDDTSFVAMLRKCFMWDPNDRLTPEAALAEPWMLASECELAPGDA